MPFIILRAECLLQRGRINMIREIRTGNDVSILAEELERTINRSLRFCDGR
ncbi:hypothetical protein SDC9_141849 [bioreactor metagenome]|uniref:Uncharacterized protein n=1 Tax=bioreactor metagenome TaxID=1076179 RepID=A0A645DZH6_9ZZZZ